MANPNLVGFIFFHLFCLVRCQRSQTWRYVHQRCLDLIILGSGRFRSLFPRRSRAAGSGGVALAVQATFRPRKRS